MVDEIPDYEEDSFNNNSGSNDNGSITNGLDNSGNNSSNGNNKEFDESSDDKDNNELLNDSESPNNNSPVEPTAKSYWKKGNELFEDDKFDDAIEQYNKALEIDPNYADAYFNKALTERIQKKYADAKRDLEKVITLQPDSADAALLVGDILESNKDYEGAKNWYNKSLSINPNYSEAKERLKNLVSSNMNKNSISNNANLNPKPNPNSIPQIGNHNSNVHNIPDFSDLDKELSNLSNNFNSKNDDDEEDDDDNKEEIEDGQIKKVPFYKSNMTFAEVVGEEKLKTFLKNNVVLAIDNPDLFKKYGKKLGVGLLMYGPPGVGKTYTVNAVAGEAHANVIIARTNQIVDMYTGNTEKNLHAIFEQARKNPPCIIFFDELDALGVKRGGGDSGGGEGSALRLAVNQFLVEMNGVEKNPEGLYVIGATNQPWDIDPAMKRSGRFGDALYIPPPNYKERKHLFDFYTKNKPRKKINFGRLSRATMGYSPADIEKICDKAIMIPLLKEYNKHVSTKLTTGDILKVIKGKVDDNVGSSLDEWYAMVKKDVISKTETQVVDGKKQTTVKEGKLDAQEKILYKTMIKDIKKNTGGFHIFVKRFMRGFAIHFF